MTTPLEAKALESLRYMRVVREQITVKSVDPLNDGVRPSLFLYRGRDEVCAIHLLGEDSSLPEVAWRSIIGFSADAAIACSESWGVTANGQDEAINPDTGQSWQPGEMQAYVARHGRGLVRDSLLALGTNAAGDQLIAEQTFIINTASAFGAATLAWDDPRLHHAGRVGSMGYLVDVMSEAFTKTGPMAQRIADIRAESGMSEEAATAMADMGTLAGLQMSTGGTMIAILSARPDQEERRQVIARIGGRPMHADPDDAFRDAGFGNQ